MSKTEENLKAAFAGESQARNKYTYFASTAKKEARVLPGEASRDDMGELMRVVDAEVAAQGTVVEALGAKG